SRRDGGGSRGQCTGPDPAPDHLGRTGRAVGLARLPAGPSAGAGSVPGAAVRRWRRQATGAPAGDLPAWRGGGLRRRAGAGSIPHPGGDPHPGSRRLAASPDPRARHRLRAARAELARHAPTGRAMTGLYAEFAEIHPATDPTPDAETAPGTGPRRPVLMLHGGNVAGWMWAEHLSRLSDRTVLTPDVPGFGKNAGLGWPGIQAVTDHFADQVRSLDQGPADVV